MRRISSFLLAIALLLPVCACAKQGPVEGEDPVRARSGSASSIYHVETVEDIPFQQALTDIVVANVCVPGEYETVVEGGVLTGVGPATLDMRVYGAAMEYEVEEVLRGDPDIVGTKIRVIEKLIRVEPQSSEHRAPLCAEPGAERVVLGLARFTDEDGTVYYDHIPEYFLMPLSDDGTLTVWPYLNRTRARITLDDFRTWCEEAEVQIEEINRQFWENSVQNSN